MVVACDFRGNIAPEIVKLRPVVIISPNHIRRPGLYAVVPLSTTPPDPICNYHHRLIGNPIPGKTGEVWAKCDLIASVAFDRLDRLKVGRGTYRIGHVPNEQLREIRLCVARSIGIVVDPATGMVIR
jgi:mRNA interferase MazF